MSKTTDLVHIEILKSSYIETGGGKKNAEKENGKKVEIEIQQEREQFSTELKCFEIKRKLD